MRLTPTSIQELQALVRETSCLLPRAGGSKFALSTRVDGITAVDVSGISGVIEYEPGEFTITTLAGTPISEVDSLLEDHGQYLPFDPPLVERGATLGGTVAAGLSGPGRYHYGGVRDFLLGVRYVDSAGNLVRGGGKVVKNAAGFDIPKLMVGSLGSLGVLVELTFKVLPRPEMCATLRLDFEALEDALQAQYKLFPSPMDIDALDLELSNTSPILWVRLAGFAAVLPARLVKLKELMGGGDVFKGTDEELIWRRARDMEWVPEGWSLVKVPLTPGRILTLDGALVQTYGEQGVIRRYSCGGQLAWLALSGSLHLLDDLLNEQSLSGLVLFGRPGESRMGVSDGVSFYRRIKKALDPNNRFAEM